MNPVILIIVAFVSILMVFFGRNPVHEAREARKKYGGDKLVQSIQEHNEKKNSMMGRLGAASAGKSPGLGSGNAAANNAAASRLAYPGYVAPGTRPPATSAPVGAGNGYYPPPPLPAGAPAAAAYPAVPAPAAPGTPISRSTGGLYLRSGQPVTFMGENVYTTDINGNRIPLPDGTYPMGDGYTTLRVQGGKKINISN